MCTSSFKFGVGSVLWLFPLVLSMFGQFPLMTKKPSTSTYLPKPATHFNGFFKTVKTFLYVKRSTKYDLMQNVKTLEIHYNTNLDFDARNSDFYSGS